MLFLSFRAGSKKHQMETNHFDTWHYDRCSHKLTNWPAPFSASLSLTCTRSSAWMTPGRVSLHTPQLSYRGLEPLSHLAASKCHRIATLLWPRVKANQDTNDLLPTVFYQNVGNSKCHACRLTCPQTEIAKSVRCTCAGCFSPCCAYKFGARLS